MTANRGKLLLGLKPIARHAFKDEKKWRSLYNDEMRGRRVAGYNGKLIPPSDVIVLEFEGRLETEIRSVVTERILREAGLERQVAEALDEIERLSPTTLVSGIKRMFKRSPESDWRDHVECVVAGLLSQSRRAKR
jgi:hypothetical protein